MFGTEKTHQRPHTSEELMAPSPAYVCKPKPVPISASVLDLYSFCRDPCPEMLWACWVSYHLLLIQDIFGWSWVYLAHNFSKVLPALFSTVMQYKTLTKNSSSARLMFKGLHKGRAMKWWSQTEATKRELWTCLENSGYNLFIINTWSLYWLNKCSDTWRTTCDAGNIEICTGDQNFVLSSWHTSFYCTWQTSSKPLTWKSNKTQELIQYQTV